MTSYIYALGDADNIRKRLQGYLLSNDLESLGNFSLSLTEAIHEVARLARETLNAEVIFSGGDDILLRLDSADFNEDKLKEIRRRFEESSGATISFGVGLSTGEAFLNLARAKSVGPGTVFLGSGIGKGVP